MYCVCVCVCVCARVRVCVSVYVSVRVCACMRVCTYAHIYTCISYFRVFITDHNTFAVTAFAPLSTFAAVPSFSDTFTLCLSELPAVSPSKLV